MNKKLLFITRHRLSENNGGANGTKGFIHCFAALFEDITLICPAFEGEATQYIPQHVKVYSYKDSRSNIQKGLDVWRGRICANEPVVRQHLKEHRYDVVVIDHSFSGASLTNRIKATGAKIVTIHHNVERDYQHDNRKDYSMLFRWPYIHFAMKAERNCLQMSDVNLTVTENDARVFRSWYPDIHVYNWGNFEYRPIPDKFFPQKSEGQTFVITGSLGFQQSLLPIMDFIHRYWPIVRQTYPQAQLLIAGRQPAEALQAACAKTEGITIVPNPADMAAVVAKADYYVCPIFIGSGRKLRILDGLKQGLPVLCHEVSAAGYESISECGCMFTYHDEKSFAMALRQMLATRIQPQQVYQTYQANFSSEAGIKRLRSILKQENIL